MGGCQYSGNWSFPDLDTVLFEDSFLYPDGPLTGQGPWTDGNIVVHSLTVANHVVADLDASPANNDAPVPDWEIHGTWAIEITITLPPAGTLRNAEYYLLANFADTSNLELLLAIWDCGDETLQIANDASGGSPQPYAPGSTHVFRTTYDGTNITTYIDGVIVLVPTPYAWGPLAAERISLFTVITDVANAGNISHVKLTTPSA